MILSVEGEENARKLCDIKELKNIKEVYFRNSFRAIGTAKYIANQNNLNIKLDDRINERELGVSKIAELPKNFTMNSFDNKDFKVGFGESLNEVDKRFNSFMKDLLNSKIDSIALFIHGILMLSFLQNNFDFNFDGHKLKLKFNDKVVYEDYMKNPIIFKIVYDDEKIIDIDSIELWFYFYSLV